MSLENSRIINIYTINFDYLEYIANNLSMSFRKLFNCIILNTHRSSTMLHIIYKFIAI